MTDTTMQASSDTMGAADKAAATVTHALRRVWRAGLGVVAVTGERFQSTFERLEQKGEQLEPSVAAPLRRAGETASRVADRAGQTVIDVTRAVGSATANLTRRPGAADVTDHLERVVEEKVAAALERLDLPTRRDFDALRERIEELAGRR